MNKEVTIPLLVESIDELAKQYVERLRFDTGALYDKLKQFQDLKKYVKENLK